MYIDLAIITTTGFLFVRRGRSVVMYCQQYDLSINDENHAVTVFTEIDFVPPRRPDTTFKSDDVAFSRTRCRTKYLPPNRINGACKRRRVTRTKTRRRSTTEQECIRPGVRASCTLSVTTYGHDDDNADDVRPFQRQTRY